MYSEVLIGIFLVKLKVRKVRCMFYEVLGFVGLWVEFGGVWVLFLSDRWVDFLFERRRYVG